MFLRPRLELCRASQSLKLLMRCFVDMMIFCRCFVDVVDGAMGLSPLYCTADRYKLPNLPILNGGDGLAHIGLQVARCSEMLCLRLGQNAINELSALAWVHRPGIHQTCLGRFVKAQGMEGVGQTLHHLVQTFELIIAKTTKNIYLPHKQNA